MLQSRRKGLAVQAASTITPPRQDQQEERNTATSDEEIDTESSVFHFLDLPVELRLAIYRLLLLADGAVHPQRIREPTDGDTRQRLHVTAITRVCQTLRGESLGVYFTGNTFSIRNDPADVRKDHQVKCRALFRKACDWLQLRIPRDCTGFIKQIQFEVPTRPQSRGRRYLFSSPYVADVTVLAVAIACTIRPAAFSVEAVTRSLRFINQDAMGLTRSALERALSLKRQGTSTFKLEEMVEYGNNDAEQAYFELGEFETGDPEGRMMRDRAHADLSKRFTDDGIRQTLAACGTLPRATQVALFEHFWDIIRLANELRSGNLGRRDRRAKPWAYDEAAFMGEVDQLMIDIEAATKYSEQKVL